MVQRPPTSSSDESHIPWVLVICLLVMALTVIVAFLFVGTIYVDLNNAIERAKAVTDVATKEIINMRELRRDVYIERQGNGEN